ncbi:MAG: tetratricopeptide repeat protein, partial [SAR202 cluster bacterium]|nr:tetratricopeptide repeat protein [SAR202 cluster bacterium]
QGALVMADDDEISRNSLFNIGNVLFLSEQYPEAIEAYKETLRIDPTDLDAKHNLELALQQLQQQQQQPQPGASEDEEGDEQQPEGEPEQQPDEEGEQEDQEQQQGQGNPSDEPQQSESEEDSDQEPQPAPIEGLTEEQALQLLQSVGENTDTLQSRIQQVLVVSGPGPESNW